MKLFFWISVFIAFNVHAERPKEFLVKIVVPTYTKCVKTYEKLVGLLCTKKVRSVKDFDDLPIKTKNNVQKTLKDLSTLAHKVCFDANKLMKKARVEQNLDQHKTDEIRTKLREMDDTKVKEKSERSLAKDKLHMAKVKRVELEDKLQLKREELDEAGRKLEQSRCRKKRSKNNSDKATPKPSDETTDAPGMSGMKAVRCQFDRILRKQRAELQKEVDELVAAVKDAKKTESNANRVVLDDKKKVDQARKEILVLESNKQTLKMNTSGAEAEVRKSKKLIDNIRVLQGHLQNVHDGITKDVKVIDRDLPVIVLSMKKINIALMGFNVNGEGKVSLPDLKKLETFADQAEKDNTRRTAEQRQ